VSGKNHNRILTSSCWPERRRARLPEPIAPGRNEADALAAIELQTLAPGNASLNESPELTRFSLALGVSRA
jgi:hypothetical protein